MPRRRLSSVDTLADEQTARIARAAYLLRQQGMSVFEISEQLKVTEAVIKHGIKLSMAEAARLITDETRSELLAMEVGRLDSLQNAVWPAAMAGDTRAVDSALKIIDKRAKLLGLEEGFSESTSHTVVVAGDTQSYISALKQIAARPYEEV